MFALCILGAVLALFTTKPVDALESPFKVSSESLDKIPTAQAGIQTFGLIDGKAPAIADESMQVLTDAVMRAQGAGDVHFALIDLDTGKGLAYNIDATQFGASSFKALYCSYVCQELVETGEISTDIVESDMVSPYFAVKEPMRAAVVESSNESYMSLVEMLRNYLPNTWLSSVGANNIAVSFGSQGQYPTYSVRESLKLWYETESYFEESNTAASEYLCMLTEMVEVSYIRDGLVRTNMANNVELTVRSKAGYSCVTEEMPVSLPAICDAGYVCIDGHPYLISVMTTLDCSDGGNRVRVENLIAALFEALWSVS